jgi:hypothetical protein
LGVIGGLPWCFSPLRDIECGLKHQLRNLRTWRLGPREHSYDTSARDQGSCKCFQVSLSSCLIGLPVGVLSRRPELLSPDEPQIQTSQKRAVRFLRSGVAL